MRFDTFVLLAPLSIVFSPVVATPVSRRASVEIAEIEALIASEVAVTCDICQEVLDKTQGFLQSQSTESFAGAMFTLRQSIRTSCNGCNLTTETTSVPWCTGFDESSARAIMPFELGSPEALAFDQTGRLVITDYIGDRLRVLDAPGAEPWTFYSWLNGPGGLAFMPDGSLLGATGITLLSTLAPTVAIGDLYRYNMTTGEQTLYATGLSQGNGLVRVPSDGIVFASDDAANSLDKIYPNGTTLTGWYHETSTDGLAVAKDSKTLYGTLAFGETQILSWDLESGSSTATSYWKAPEELAWAVMDDLDIDPEGRLYAAIWAAGEVWRIDTDGTACALSKGRPFTAGISLGPLNSDGGISYSTNQSAFVSDSVYFTTHLGAVMEIPHAVPTA